MDTGADWSNQNCHSLTASASRTKAGQPAGAVADTWRVAVCPGGRSAGRLNRWSVNQAFQGWPGAGAKCRLTRTWLVPVAGQVWLPALTTVTSKVCVCPAVQLDGAARRS